MSLGKTVNFPPPICEEAAHISKVLKAQSSGKKARNITVDPKKSVISSRKQKIGKREINSFKDVKKDQEEVHKISIINPRTYRKHDKHADQLYAIKKLLKGSCFHYSQEMKSKKLDTRTYDNGRVQKTEEEILFRMHCLKNRLKYFEKRFEDLDYCCPCLNTSCSKNRKVPKKKELCRGYLDCEKCCKQCLNDRKLHNSSTQTCYTQSAEKGIPRKKDDSMVFLMKGKVASNQTTCSANENLEDLKNVIESLHNKLQYLMDKKLSSTNRFSSEESSQIFQGSESRTNINHILYKNQYWDLTESIDHLEYKIDKLMSLIKTNFDIERDWDCVSERVCNDTNCNHYQHQIQTKSEPDVAFFPQPPLQWISKPKRRLKPVILKGSIHPEVKYYSAHKYPVLVPLNKL